MTFQQGTLMINGSKIAGAYMGGVRVDLAANGIRLTPGPINLMPEFPTTVGADDGTTHITCTANGDGSYTFTGDSTGTNSYTRTRPPVSLTLPAGTYRARLEPAQSQIGIDMRLPAYTEVTGEKTFTLDEQTTIQLYLFVRQYVTLAQPVTVTPTLIRIS